MSSTRKSIAYNSVFSLVDKTYTALSGLLLIPFIIHTLGVTTYGFWVLLVTVSGYFGLGSLGISSAFEKFIAQYIAKNDHKSLNRYITTAFYTSILLGIIVLSAAVFFAPIVFHVLLKNGTFDNYHSLFFVVMISVVLSIAGAIFLAVPRGLQRFDIAAGISIAGRTAYILCVVLLSIKGLGIWALVYAQIAFAAITALASLYIAMRRIQGFNCWPQFFDWQICMTMLNFGIKMLISLCAVLVTQSFDKLVIAYYLDVRCVALYDIGARLISFVKDVPSFVYSVITPRTSELHALDNLEGLRSIYVQGTKYLAIVCIGIIALMFPVAHEILTAWIGTSIDPFSIYVFQVLVFSTMLYVTTGFGTAIGIGIGRPGTIALVNIIMAVVNMVGSVALFYTFKTWGIVWGTALGMLSSSIVYYYILNRQMGVGQWYFWKKTLLFPIVVNACAIAIVLMVKHLYYSSLPGESGHKAVLYAIIVLNGICMVIINSAAYKVSGYITLQEIVRYVPFIKKYIRINE
jgi:O-antigen/teichoic acid export membrane protein